LLISGLIVRQFSTNLVKKFGYEPKWYFGTIIILNWVFDITNDSVYIFLYVPYFVMQKYLRLTIYIKEQNKDV